MLLFAFYNFSYISKVLTNEGKRRLKLKQKQDSEIAKLDRIIALESFGSSTSTDDATYLETEKSFGMTSSKPKRKRGKISMMTAKVLP